MDERRRNAATAPLYFVCYDRTDRQMVDKIETKLKRRPAVPRRLAQASARPGIGSLRRRLAQAAATAAARASASSVTAAAA